MFWEDIVSSAVQDAVGKLFMLSFYLLLPAYMSTTYVSGIGGGQRGGHQIPGSGITGACEPQCAYWLSIPNPLEEQPVLSTARPSLHPLESSLVTVVFVLTIMLVMCDDGSLLW